MQQNPYVISLHMECRDGRHRFPAVLFGRVEDHRPPSWPDEGGRKHVLYWDCGVGDGVSVESMGRKREERHVRERRQVGGKE